MMIKYLRLFNLTVWAAALTIVFGSCEEQLNIAEFADDYSEYESELRIEAVLDAVEPANSIVRVDWTMLVTDTSIFNGRDDDGDWNPETDDTGKDGTITDEGELGPPPDEGEGNGRPDPGEPHVDEYDEILPQLHDSTLTVALIDPATDDVLIEFAWQSRADSFQFVPGSHGEMGIGADAELVETVYYGAYRPETVYVDTIAYYKEYEFRLTKQDGPEITGVTTPLPPVVYDLNGSPDGNTLIADTLLINTEGIPRFRWYTDEALVDWVVVDRIFSPDSIVRITSHPAGPIGQDNEGNWVHEDIMGLYSPGLYRWTVIVPSRAYGAYIYSNLPMRDEQLSNLRDENDCVVLGIAGSASPAIQYVRVPE
ncbi:MAG: hypothetical protein KAU50_05500 [Candidatus Marinimicrobia bacterium]|nr:hypothetical protein [Candidatus Neomarinimicrobiota bacterium]